MGNDICHAELYTDDVPGAQAFYQRLFTWEIQHVELPGGQRYLMFQPGEGPAGGILDKPMPDAPNGWLPYFRVERMEEVLSSAKAMGATLVVPTTAMEGNGQFAVLQDPTGAYFGVWSAGATGE